MKNRLRGALRVLALGSIVAAVSCGNDLVSSDTDSAEPSRQEPAIDLPREVESLKSTMEECPDGSDLDALGETAAAIQAIEDSEPSVGEFLAGEATICPLVPVINMAEALRDRFMAAEAQLCDGSFYAVEECTVFGQMKYEDDGYDAIKAAMDNWLKPIGDSIEASVKAGEMPVEAAALLSLVGGLEGDGVAGLGSFLEPSKLTEEDAWPGLPLIRRKVKPFWMPQQGITYLYIETQRTQGWIVLAPEPSNRLTAYDPPGFGDDDLSFFNENLGDAASEAGELGEPDLGTEFATLEIEFDELLEESPHRRGQMVPMAELGDYVDLLEREEDLYERVKELYEG